MSYCREDVLVEDVDQKSFQKPPPSLKDHVPRHTAHGDYPLSAG